MTSYEQKMLDAQNNDKVIFYDYLMYKQAAGWSEGLIGNDWYRPSKVKRAKYNASFLKKIPDYYFLGIPIKELIKSECSSGYCHACAIALSLCFKEFEIVTCNLKSIADHNNAKSDYKIKQYEHTFLVVNIDGKKTVIDTTMGLITRFNTYKHIFSCNKIKIISSKEIKETEVYKFIESQKLINKLCSHSEFFYDHKYGEYIHKYMEMCKSYENTINNHLQDFINRCLFRTSNEDCFAWWIWNLDKTCHNFYIEYPSTDMFSLVDEEYDNNLFSKFEKTNEYNKKVLESYHTIKQPQSKVLKLFTKYKNK